MQIIGIGNLDRGDDAAGLLAARRLGGLEHTGDALSLIDAWGEAEDVLLIDAVVTGAVPGTLHRWDARHLPPEAVGLRASTHAFSVVDAIRLAESTGRLPHKLVVLGIEAAQFEPGTAPSPPVLRAVNELCVNGGGEAAPSYFPAQNSAVNCRAFIVRPGNSVRGRTEFATPEGSNGALDPQHPGRSIPRHLL
jgi:hydrogenase maturation protease